MATRIYDEVERNPSAKKLLEFGATFLGGTVALGLVFHFVKHDHALARGLWIAGAAVFALSFFRPVGRILYILWMGLGVTIGLVTQPILLVVVFLLLITPVGLFFRLIRRDAMKRKRDPDAASYWEEYEEPRDPATYVKQY